MKLVVSVLLFLSFSVVSAEEGDVHIGGAFAIWDYEEKGNPDFSPKSLELVSIYNFLPYLDFQGNLGIGIGETTEIDESGDEIGLKLSNYFSVYAKPNYDIMNYSFYGLVGYSVNRLEASVDGISASDSSNGISYGAGITVNLSEYSNFQIEWRQQADTSAYEFSGFTIGYNYRIN